MILEDMITDAKPISILNPSETYLEIVDVATVNALLPSEKSIHGNADEKYVLIEFASEDEVRQKVRTIWHHRKVLLFREE